jgi:hypothetical protein
MAIQMGIRSVGQAAHRNFGEQGRDEIIEIRRGREVTPQTLAKRLDGQISIWLSDYVSKLRHPKADLSGLIAAANPNFPGFSYLPGRRPLIKADKELIDGSVALRLKQMQRYGLLTEAFDPLYQEAAEIVFSFAVNAKLPLLSVERAIGMLFDGVLPNETGLDPFHGEKRITRRDMMQLYENIIKIVSKEKGHTLNRAFDFAVRANNLSLIGNVDYDKALSEYHVMPYINAMLSQRINYYRNDLAAAFPPGGRSRKIAYMLGYAGGSILDLIAVTVLKLQGHEVKVVACSSPCLNYETAGELNAHIINNTVTRELPAYKDEPGKEAVAVAEASQLLGVETTSTANSADAGQGLRLLADYYVEHSPSVPILAGSPQAGSDLTAITPETRAALDWADLWVLEGEDKLQGIPPECGFRKDILYLLIAKNPQLFEGISRFIGKSNDPQPGDAVAWFRPAA